MDWEVHPDAVKEFVELEDEASEVVKGSIEARKSRENSILNQRGVGLSYDNHGEPIQYFKAEKEGESYRVFFDISGNKVILLGVRERTDETYFNLREYTKRMENG